MKLNVTTVVGSNEIVKRFFEKPQSNGRFESQDTFFIFIFIFTSGSF